MIKKILLILLIPSLFLIALLGRNYIKNQEDVDKIMQYVDCDDIYVGTYAGWIEMRLSRDILRGYENAKQFVDHSGIPTQREPIAVFVDIDGNIRVEGVNSSDYSFTGKIEEDGSFEINEKGIQFSGKFVFDEEISRLSASGTSEYTMSFGHLDLPTTVFEVEAFDISAECYISEEIVYDLTDEGDIEKEFDSEDKVVRIKSKDDSEVILKTNTKIKYNRDADDVLLDMFRGRILANVSKLPDDRKYEVASPQSVSSVRGTKFTMDVEEDKTVVFVEEGEVEVKSLDGEKSITLTDGDMVVIIGDEFPEGVVNIYKEKGFLEKIGISF